MPTTMNLPSSTRLTMIERNRGFKTLKDSTDAASTGGAHDQPSILKAFVKGPEPPKISKNTPFSSARIHLTQTTHSLHHATRFPIDDKTISFKPTSVISTDKVPP